MKLIVATIGPEKMDAVQLAVRDLDAYLMSVSQVVGDPREPGFTEIYRGRQIRVPRPKLRLEMVVHDTAVKRAVDAIVRIGIAADAGPAANGNILVMQLDRCVRIAPGGLESPDWASLN
jgi:nitrogen regulatory protein PII